MTASALAGPEDAWAQSSRPPARTAKPVPKPATPALKRDPAQVACPTPLGIGVTTRRVFCDVLSGRDPAQGIRIVIPPHKGTATLLFDLHNRQTYSEEQVKARKAYARYTATIGVLTLQSDLLSRAVVQSEFRTAADLVDRIDGGAGPGGVKAVAPTGTESIAIAIPENVDEVSILGEKLEVESLERRDLFSVVGRPIAIISNVTIEYLPGPPRRPRSTAARP